MINKTKSTASEIKAIGKIPSGSHICQFYKSKKELLEIALPFFKAGLNNNEFCVWITSQSLTSNNIKKLLKKEIKNADALFKKGQIELLDHSQWDKAKTSANRDNILDKLRNSVLNRKFSGLRIIQNKTFLNTNKLFDFSGIRNITLLVSYALNKCTYSQTIKIIANYHLSLIKENNKWITISNSLYKKAANDLLETTNKYELLLENIPLHIGAIDKSGKFTVWNKYSEKLFGYTKEEAIGKLAAEELASLVSNPEQIRQILKEKGIFNGEIQLKHKNGSPVDVHIIIAPFKDKKGEIINLYGFAEDISEHNKAREKINSLAKFPSENPYPVIRTNSKGLILFANKSSTKSITDWKCETGNFVPDDLKKTITNSMISKKIQKIEITSGKNIFLFSLVPVMENDYVNMYGIDITEMKKVERALMNSQHVLEEQVDERTRLLKVLNKNLKRTTDNLNIAQSLANIGSWHFDIIKNLLTWSDETYRIFGLDKNHYITYDKFIEKVHPDDRGYVNKKWDEALQGKPYNIIHRIVVDNKVKWINEIARVDFNKNGEPVRGVGTVQDITKQKEQEDSIRTLNEELNHISRVSTMGELTASLAHELNQPLTAIMSNAQTALKLISRKEPDIKEIEEILSDIVYDDKRAGEIIKKLRALLKKSLPVLEPLNINELIEEVISLLHSEAVINNISFNIDLNKNIPKINGDKIQLQQVLLNFIINSLEAMKNAVHKNLYVQTQHKNNNFISVYIADTGKGFDDKIINNLFNPFFTTKKDGMGMGLAINKTIIEAHGGSISVKNNNNQGAIFSFLLPVAGRIENE